MTLYDDIYGTKFKPTWKIINETKNRRNEKKLDKNSPLNSLKKWMPCISRLHTEREKIDVD